MNDSASKPIRLISIYARVSTARQEEDGTIETQLAAVREYAKKNEYTVVREYVDEGWSGDTLKRPNLDELRQDAKDKLWDGVLFYDPDRLARRYSYQELVMDELKEAGVEVMFVTVPAPKNSEDKILHGVRGLFAEYERTKIAERFRLGKLRSIKEGHIIASRPLYGYTRVVRNGNEQGYYVINEEEAVVVRKIFAWIANGGLTIRQVVRELQVLGIKPQRSKRGVWSTSTLTTMLRNEGYIGRAHWYSSVAVEPKNPISKEKYRKIKKSSTKKRPKSEWMYVAVPAIVDEELFNRAGSRLTEHATLNPRSKKYEYLLGGKIKCPCGQKRIGAGRKLGQYLYYDCCDKVLCFPLPRKCYEQAINARIADKLVWAKLSDLMSSPDLLTKQAGRWAKARQDKAKVSVGDSAGMEKQIAKLKEEQERYTKAYGSGVFTMEQLKEYTTPVREKITSLETQISKVQQAVRRVDLEAPPTEKEIEAFAKEAHEALLDLNFQEKRAIVLYTVEEIIGTQQQLQVSGYIPVTTTNGWYKTKDRNRRTAECWEVDII